MKNLIKNQDEEIKKILNNRAFGMRYEDDEELKTFISKVRKETAEEVCDKIIGERHDLISGDDFQKGFFDGVYHRVKEEKEIKQQILDKLKQ